MSSHAAPTHASAGASPAGSQASFSQVPAAAVPRTATGTAAAPNTTATGTLTPSATAAASAAAPHAASAPSATVITTDSTSGSTRDSSAASTPASTPERPLDLLIIGAGISGVDLGYHVNKNFPGWDWEIHDNHSDVGGTWHTVRYPGVRSDSDMATFNFPFYHWPHSGTLGQGGDIQRYIRDAATHAGVMEHVHLRSRVDSVDWRSEHSLYRVETVRTSGEAGATEPVRGEDGREQRRTIWARRVHFATGYFVHGAGYRPPFPGEEDFSGQIIHPQQWPEGLDVRGKSVAVIGSGATAISLIPALVDGGAQVTMVQRTPTYIAPLPDVDVITKVWTAVLPQRVGVPVARANHALRDEVQYLLAQHTPWLFSTALRVMQRRFVSSAEIREHFTPPYKPWDQRVCRAPDGDFFQALKRGGRVVTGKIDRFTPSGIRLASGEEIPADVIVSATGMNLQAFGSIDVRVDGVPTDMSKHVTYRGVLLSGLPNASFSIGYFNASWTLRAELVAKYLMRLWKTGESLYVPVVPQGRMDRDLWEMESGYVRRGMHQFPTQGDEAPWRYEQNYPLEFKELGYGDLRRDMAFGADVAAHVGELGGRTAAPAAHGGRIPVQTIPASGPYVKPDYSALPPTRFVPAGSGQLRVRVREESQVGEPRRVVVMIHGMGRSLEDWDDQVLQWDARDRVIAVDIPGFGGSPALERPHFAGVVDRIWAAVDSVCADLRSGSGVPRIHLLGNSLGAGISMAMTAARPGGIASAVLIDPVAFGRSMSILLRIIAVPGVGRVNALLTRLRPIYQPVEHVILRRPGVVTRGRVRVTGRVSQNPGRSRTFYGLMREMATPFGWREGWQQKLRRDYLAAAKPAGIPTALLWGRSDVILPFSHFRTALEHLQPEMAVVVERCGHMAQLEYPQEFQQVAEQLQDLAEERGLG